MAKDTNEERHPQGCRFLLAVGVQLFTGTVQTFFANGANFFRQRC